MVGTTLFTADMPLPLPFTWATTGKAKQPHNAAAMILVLDFTAVCVLQEHRHNHGPVTDAGDQPGKVADVVRVATCMPQHVFDWSFCTGQ